MHFLPILTYDSSISFQSGTQGWKQETFEFFLSNKRNAYFMDFYFPNREESCISIPSMEKKN